MSQSEFFMVSLEGRLFHDEDGQFRQTLIADLERQLDEVDQSMRAGLAPDEYEQANSWKVALQAAMRVVQQVKTPPLPLEDDAADPISQLSPVSTD